MERTKYNTMEVRRYASELTNRALLADMLGVQFSGKRNLYNVLGYKKDLSWSDFWTQYRRQDIASAIIDRPVKTTWRGDIQLIEVNDENTTPLEKMWTTLADDLKIKSKLIRLDKLSGIGRYGVLLLGFSDVDTTQKWQTPVTPSKSLKLMYLKPFGEGTAKIEKFETNPQSPRYGEPLFYTINVEGQTIRVHYSRVIHVIDNPMESEVYGTPRLEVVFNRLMDLEKLVGGSAEMFWRNARPGYAGNVDKDMSMGKAEEDALERQLDEYEHDLRRILINQGIDLHALQAQIADPANHADIQLQMISAATGIPKRILVGSERGELSSTQDSEEWLGTIQSRREEYAEPQILRPLIDRLIQYQILPKPTKGEYFIGWTELFSQSDKEKAEVGKIRATALKEYASTPVAADIMPFEMFLKFLLGLKDDEIQLILTLQEEKALENINFEEKGSENEEETAENENEEVEENE